MSSAVKPRKVMATLDKLRLGNSCPHEGYCACRQGSQCPEAKATKGNCERDYPMMHLAGCSFAYDRCYCRVLEEIDFLAGEYLKHGGVDEPPIPLELINLFDATRPIEMRYLPLKRYLGCTWFIDGEWVVHINENAPSDTRNYTAFHEGFHIICGSSGLAFKGAADGYQAVSERLADYFAASILMPKHLVHQFWPDVRDLGKMAKIFAVPEPVMKDWLYRLRITAT